MKKVSIIVPMYGVEKYIKDCLESVAAQTFKDIECIIIDDCSPDHSYDVAREFIDDYKGEIEFKIVRHQVNKGLSGARNTGIESSTGEYLFFLDSDDLITENAIEVLLANSHHDPDIVMGNNLIFSDYTGEIIRPPKTTSKDYYYFDSLYDYMSNHEIINLNYFGIVWNKLFKKAFIDTHELRFDEGIYFEDDVWSFKIYSHGPIVAFIPKETYKYRVRDNSIMTMYNETHLLSSIKSAFIVLQYVKKGAATEKWYVKQSAESYMQSALYSCIYRTNDKSCYYKVYDIFRNLYRPSFLFWFDMRISMGIKFKALHYYIPLIGAHYLKAVFSIQRKKINKIKLAKIDISMHFWDKVNSILNEYCSKMK